MSCFYSLHDDILDSIYLSLWRVVYLTRVWHHICWYILNFTGCIIDVSFDIQCVLFGWCKGEGVTSQVIHINKKQIICSLIWVKLYILFKNWISCHVFTHFMLIFWKAISTIFVARIIRNIRPNIFSSHLWLFLLLDFWIISTDLLISWNILFKCWIICISWCCF